MNTYLESQKINCLNAIASCRSIIRTKERAYESLLRFKRIVVSSQQDFHTVNNRNKAILSDLSAIENKCKTVFQYKEGMNRIFQVDGKAVSITFDVLLGLISSKLSSYLNIIAENENKIGQMEQRIAEIDRMINEERRVDKK